MKNLAFIVVLLCASLSVSAWAAKVRPPSEVLSDIQYITRGGVQGVKIDFAIPVHYMSHNPQRVGAEITVDIQFNRTEVPDTSELPLLQSLVAPPSDDIPIKDVTYMTQDGKARLVVTFTKQVRFNVSQIMGINSLVFFVLSDAQENGDGITIEELNIKPKDKKEEAPKEGESIEDAKARKVFDSGRAALTKGDNKQAVQIFTALISQSGHRYLQESLELLGVARERSGQTAQAKAVYEQYIEKYPKGDGTDRVKQRLADMISGQLSPRSKLKDADKDGRLRNTLDSKLVASFSQYINYQESHDATGLHVDSAQLSNQLSAAWRVRKGDYDIRTNLFTAYDKDTYDGTTDGLEVGNLYAKVRNSSKKYDFTIGRQSSAPVGVLDRFDGLYAGYEFSGNRRFNLVWGYPVDIEHKREIQTSKPFYGVSVELNGLWKNWDIAPYLMRQDVDGVLNRSALGTELRFAQEGIDAFAWVDYDDLFNEVNIFQFRGKYDLRKETSLRMTVDVHKNPFLETSNSLVQLSEGTTINDLLNQNIDESTLRRVAADRTGITRFLSLGFSHEFNKRYQINGEVDFSNQDYRYADSDGTLSDLGLLNLDSSAAVDSQTDIVVQLIVNNWLEENGTALFFLDTKLADTYNELIYSMEYRQPLKGQFRLSARLRLRQRENDSGVGLRRIIPGANLEWRWSQDMRLFLDGSVEDWHYSNAPLNGDFRVYQIFAGYSWDF